MRGSRLNSQGSLARQGFTMVELMVAAGLAAVLMVALFRLLDTALDMWTPGRGSTSDRRAWGRDC